MFVFELFCQRPKFSFVVYIRGAFHSGPYIGLGIQRAVQNTRSLGLLFEFRVVRDSGVIETGCLKKRNAWNEEKLNSKNNVTAQKF